MRRAELLKLAIVLAVACATVAVVLWPALGAQARGPDDYEYYVENPLVRNPSFSAVGTFLSEVTQPSTVRGYYQPLSMISLMADSAMGADAIDLRVFHRTNLVLHVANTSLVIVLLWLLFGNAVVAGVVGILFGLHPMVVEPLCWVSDRKTLLAALFALASLCCYVRTAQSPRRWAWLTAATVAYLAAVLSKPTSVPLPVAMLLLDVWPLRRFGVRAIVEKWPLYVIMLASAGVTVVSQGATSNVSAGAERSVLQAPLLVGYELAFYAQKIVWPADLTSYYSPPQPVTITNAAVGVRVGIVAVAAVALGLLWRRARGPAIGALIFLVLLLPTTGIIGFTKVLTADKFAYLPAIGVLCAGAWGLVRFVGGGAQRASKGRLVFVIVAGLLIAAAEGVAARRQIATWADTVTFAERMVRLAPNDVEPHISYGVALQQAGLLEKAVAAFEKALEIAPGSAKAAANLANVYAEAGHSAKAIELYEQIVAREGQFGEVFDIAEAYYNLGLLRARDGDPAGAEAAYRAALQRDPRHVSAMNNLANLLMRQQEYDEALQLLDGVIARDPQHVNARVNKATALAMTGEPAAALVELETVLRISPDYVPALLNRGLVYEQLGRPDEARAAYAEMLRRHPDHAVAQARLRALSGASGGGD